MNVDDPEDLEPAALGDRIEDRYTILDRLGEGGMGVVYLAQDEKNNRRVALKFPKKELQYKKGFRSRFASEIRSLIEFEHGNVVRVYDAGVHHGTPFMVLQYLEGGTLAQRLEKGPQSAREVMHWLPRIAGALDALHRQGVVHRDVKALNILFDRHGEPLISDFGICKVLVDLNRAMGTATEGGAIGSPESLAPEYIEGNYTGAYDQYGLATTVFQCLSGRLPFVSESPSQVQLKLATAAPPALQDVAPNVTPALSAVVGKALSKLPAQRYPTCAAFADAFGDALSASAPTGSRQTPWSAAPEPAPLEPKVGSAGPTIGDAIARLDEHRGRTDHDEPVRDGSQRRRWAVAAAVLGCLLVALLWWMRGPSDSERRQAFQQATSLETQAVALQNQLGALRDSSEAAVTAGQEKLRLASSAAQRRQAQAELAQARRLLALRQDKVFSSPELLELQGRLVAARQLIQRDGRDNAEAAEQLRTVLSGYQSLLARARALVERAEAEGEAELALAAFSAWSGYSSLNDTETSRDQEIRRRFDSLKGLEDDAQAVTTYRTIVSDLRELRGNAETRLDQAHRAAKLAAETEARNQAARTQAADETRKREQRQQELDRRVALDRQLAPYLGRYLKPDRTEGMKTQQCNLDIYFASEHQLFVRYTATTEFNFSSGNRSGTVVFGGGTPTRIEPRSDGLLLSGTFELDDTPTRNGDLELQRTSKISVPFNLTLSSPSRTARLTLTSSNPTANLCAIHPFSYGGPLGSN